MQSDLNRLIRASFSDQHHALESLLSIGYLPVKARSTLVTLCRTQVMPTKGTRVYARLQIQLQQTYDTQSISASSDRKPRTLLQICSTLSDLIQSPYLSGFLSMLLRNVGYVDISSIRETFNETVAKEVRAAVEVYRPVVLRWDRLLDQRSAIRRQFSIHESYGVAWMVNETIFKAFCQTKRLLALQLFYPDIGQKTVGRLARQQIDQAAREECIPITHTLIDVEQLYHRRGIRIGGQTEMRWAWKYNNLKPRVYYARGPDVYYASRYIQGIFNVILEQFPQVSKFGRRSTSSLRLTAESRFFIYDYTSFTSTLEEIKNFLLTLADFYRGTTIRIVDTYHGVIERDLGEVLDEYNEVCSYFPEFDASDVDWEQVKREGPELLLNHTCGMLGVPGNISSDTLLHGLHLMLVIESLECKIVGDDAAGVDDDDDPIGVAEKLQNIGQLEPSKVESWNHETVEQELDPSYDPSWNYVKRPITRIANRIVVTQQLVWPPICVILQIKDSFHTIPTCATSDDAFKAANRMLLSFLLSLRTMPYPPEEYEKEMIRRIYQQCRVAITRKFGPRDHLTLLPKDPWTVKDLDDWLFEMQDKVIPMRAIYSGGEQEVVLDEEISLTNSPGLKLARQLGYATVEDRIELRRVGSNVDLFRNFLLRETPVRFSYNVVISSRIPQWLYKLVTSYYSDPDFQTSDDLDLDEDPFMIVDYDSDNE